MTSLPVSAAQHWICRDNITQISGRTRLGLKFAIIRVKTLRVSEKASQALMSAHSSSSCDNDDSSSSSFSPHGDDTPPTSPLPEEKRAPVLVDVRFHNTPLFEAVDKQPYNVVCNTVFQLYAILFFFPVP
jgi:hypothetical protein